MTPVLDNSGSYKLGIWVRDNIQGIGTLTYVEQDGSFGALGHGISDVDVGEILKVGKGELYQADILSVVKGQNGSPGELQGVIHYYPEELIGEIEDNSAWEYTEHFLTIIWRNCRCGRWKSAGSRK